MIVSQSRVLDVHVLFAYAHNKKIKMVAGPAVENSHFLLYFGVILFMNAFS